MTSIKPKTLAEQFADALDNNGQMWRTRAGMEFADLLDYVSPAGVHHQRIDEGEMTRHMLADGSAIVECGGCWDIEHSELRFWMATEDPNDEELLRHVYCLEREGYSADPAEINHDFKLELSEHELLFRRILDAAVEAKDEYGSPGALIYAWLKTESDYSDELATAAYKLAGKGLLFGAAGELGGVTVFEENGDETAWDIDWKTDQGTWVNLDTLLAMAEQGDDGVPDWFDRNLVMVRDDKNKWVVRGAFNVQLRSGDAFSEQTVEQKVIF
jgi:hypothetical protein